MYRVYLLIPLLIMSFVASNSHAMGYPGSIGNLIEHLALHSPERLQLMASTEDRAEHGAQLCGMLCAGLCGIGDMGLGVWVTRICCLYNTTLAVPVGVAACVGGFCLLGCAGAYTGLRLGRSCAPEFSEDGESA